MTSSNPQELATKRWRSTVHSQRCPCRPHSTTRLCISRSLAVAALARVSRRPLDTSAVSPAAPPGQGHGCHLASLATTDGRTPRRHHTRASSQTSPDMPGGPASGTRYEKSDDMVIFNFYTCS